MFAAAALLFEQAFVIALRAQRNAQVQAALIGRVDAAVAALRRDVWAATAVRTEGDRLVVEQPGGVAIRWQWAEDGTLTRTAVNGPPQAWPGLPRMTFTAAGPLVTLAVPPTEGQPEERAVFASQRLLAGRPAGGTMP